VALGDLHKIPSYGYFVSSSLIVKKRRPINKKEAKRYNEALSRSHNLNFEISAGKYEKGICRDFEVIIQKGHIIAIIIDNVHHLSVRGLLEHKPQGGWVQVDMGAVPYVCNGANVMSAGINDASDEILKGQYVWIREETHHKPLGVGKVVMSKDEMLKSDKGKAIEALHYIGDKIWSYGVKD
jgi:PUA domain protein